MKYVETKTGSWAIDHEDFAYWESQPQWMQGSVDWGNLPRIELPKSDWLPTENQHQQGACRGHSLSTGMEIAYYWTTGQHVQLSRACAYYETQRIDGIRGDRGSTIAGGIKLALNTGIVAESNWPYPSRYNPSRPSGYDSMLRWKLESSRPCRSYEEVIEHLAERKGPVDIGISWGSEIDRQVSRNGRVETFSGAGGGGHAVLLASYDLDLLDADGFPYGDLFNSWGPGWGQNGWCKVSPRAIRQMLSHRHSVFVGHIGSVHPPIDQPNWSTVA